MTVRKNSTGCSLLDSKGVTEGELYKGARICLDCPYSECVLTNSRGRKKITSSEKEIFVMCKNCGAAETLTVRKGKLVSTQKWQQRGDKIYHIKDCGEAK